MINKKGVSNVIASVVLVALTVVALVIIAQFVVPFVKNNLQKSGECLDYQKYFVLDNSFGYNCKKNGIGYVISVKAEGQKELEDKVSGLKLVLYNGAITAPLEVKDGKTRETTFFMIDPGNFKVPKTGEIQSYAYNVSQTFDRVEIYTLLKSGRTCETPNDQGSLGACR
ncbi:MAG: hypothetical protein Q7R87_04050 [Nanoarchaeota archaeon]|nr:hypothetical protein [Nanoarchaeota archaeon]